MARFRGLFRCRIIPRVSGSHWAATHRQSLRPRRKRQIAQFADLPANLVNAVVSAEDKHFFHHTGFDGMRILKAAYVDLKDGRKEQGASTLTMQLARGFFLDADKRWKRKFEEAIHRGHVGT